MKGSCILQWNYTGSLMVLNEWKDPFSYETLGLKNLPAEPALNLLHSHY